MVKIVGFQHKEGKFKNESNQDISYNNVVLFYISDCVEHVVGCSVGEIKISFDKCKAITGFDYASLPEILNKNVELSYIPVGRYQQLNSIRVLDEVKK